MRIRILLILLFINAASVFSQNFLESFIKGDYDSLYYDDLAQSFTVKLYSARSKSSYDLDDQKIAKDLNYLTNSIHSYGAGFSYKWLGMNLGFAFPFLNTDDTLYGDTRIFDFSTQMNLRKATFTVYFKSSKGFYLENSQEAISAWPENDYYIRGDMKELTYGISGSYLFNHTRYSNRATLLQNEWQKKSAGSFVLGGTMLVNKVMGDSSLVPSNIQNPDFFRGYDFSKSKYFSLTSEFGYTFTLVLLQHWYFNAMVMTGLGVGSSKVFIDDGSIKEKVGMNIALASNFGIGYNSKRFFAGINYTTLNANSPTAIQSCLIGSGLSRYRFVLAYRFHVKPDFRLIPEWVNLPKWIPEI